MVYLGEFGRIKKNLIDRRAQLLGELKRLPDGNLYVYSRDGEDHYYQRLPKAGNRKKEKRTGIKKNQDLLMALVRKEYVKEAIEILEKDIKEIERLETKYVPADENSVMESFLDRYPELTEGIYYGTFSAEKWAEGFKRQSDYHKEHLTSTAADGTPRRSLGEIIIGAKLDQYGISYRYEAPAHPDLPYMPDFTIIRPRDGKVIFWEHIGKVKDKEYMAGNKKKFEAYEGVGIVPWDNLIISYSRADGGINEKLIDALVQGWLL